MKRAMGNMSRRLKTCLCKGIPINYKLGLTPFDQLMTSTHTDGKIKLAATPPLGPIIEAQGFLRLCIGIPMALAFAGILLGKIFSDIPEVVYAGIIAYCVYSVLTWMAPCFLPAHLLLPAIYFTAVVDSVFLVYWLPMADDVPGIIVGLALFTGLGYGLRTGSKAIMYTNQGTMIVGYLGLLLLYPELIQHPLRALSFVVPFFLVPMYVGTLLDQLHAARRKAEEAATTDSLTGTKNRRCFDEDVKHEWGRCNRTRTHLSMIMLDVDFSRNTTTPTDILPATAFLKPSEAPL